MVLIVADLSYDPTYAEVLHQTFGSRVIGLQISRHGRWHGRVSGGRQVKHGSVPVYNNWQDVICSNCFHTELQADQIRLAEGPEMPPVPMNS